MPDVRRCQTLSQEKRSAASAASASSLIGGLPTTGPAEHSEDAIRRAQAGIWIKPINTFLHDQQRANDSRLLGESLQRGHERDDRAGLEGLRQRPPQLPDAHILPGQALISEAGQDRRVLPAAASSIG
jgi:hypothetical protein